MELNHRKRHSSEEDVRGKKKKHKRTKTHEETGGAEGHEGKKSKARKRQLSESSISHHATAGSSASLGDNADETPSHQHSLASSSTGSGRKSAFGQKIRQVFPSLTEEQWRMLEQLGSLVQEWNNKVNVISRKDIDSVIEKHIIPCMGLSLLLADAPEHARLMDVGTGGGFPGLPLAICCPHIDFLLCDSIGKKIKVVQDIAARIGLKNVTAKQMRAEDAKETFHYITGRSVTAMPRFVGWVRDKLIPLSKQPQTAGSAQTSLPRGGILYIKGGITEENQVEDLGGYVPEARYVLKELLGEDVYDGDKAVLHFTPEAIKNGSRQKRRNKPDKRCPLVNNGVLRLP